MLGARWTRAGSRSMPTRTRSQTRCCTCELRIRKRAIPIHATVASKAALMEMSRSRAAVRSSRAGMLGILGVGLVLYVFRLVSEFTHVGALLPSLALFVGWLSKADFSGVCTGRLWRANLRFVGQFSGNFRACASTCFGLACQRRCVWPDLGVLRGRRLRGRPCRRGGLRRNRCRSVR